MQMSLRTNPYCGGIMGFGTYVALGIAALVTACASQSDYIAPTYVSPSSFEHMTCRQIGEEAKRVARNEAVADQAGKTADATEIGLLKGTMEALEQVSIEKNCNIQFEQGSAAIENKRENRPLLPDCYPPLCATSQ